MTLINKSFFKTFILNMLRFFRKSAVKPLPLIDKKLQAFYMDYNKQRFYGPQKYFCYAPFGSVFINYRGEVSPCYACKSKDTLIDKSLDQLWKGPVFEDLRNQFRQGLIPEACNFCKNHFEAGNHGSVLANKYDHYMMSSSGMPVIAELELSNTCHLECIMCSGTLSSSIRKNREKLPPVDILLPSDFLNQFEKFIPFLKTIEFTGGDPFLIDIYYDIFENVEIFNTNIHILITTNANTINKKTETLLKRNLKLNFNISIDSLQDETYAFIRKNAILQKTLDNINILADYVKKNNSSLGFLVCPLRYNWKELPEFVNFANKYHATLSYHVVFKPAEHALWSLTHTELKEISSYLNSFHFKAYDFNSRINLRSYIALTKLVQKWSNNALIRETNKAKMFEQLSRKINISKKSIKNKLNQPEMFENIDRIVSGLKDLDMPELVFLMIDKKTKKEISDVMNSFSEEELNRKLNSYHQEVWSSVFYFINLSDNDKYFENTF